MALKFALHIEHTNLGALNTHPILSNKQKIQLKTVGVDTDTE